MQRLRVVDVENSKLIIAVLTIVVTSILVYNGSIGQDVFITIMSFILGYYFGSAHVSYYMYKKFKIYENYKVAKDQIIRFGTILLISGITLIIQKYVCHGAVITFPPIWDHGLYGVIMVVIGAIILTKIRGRYWIEHERK